MQYLVSVIDDRTNSGTPEESRAIDEFNERLRAGGYWVFAAASPIPVRRRSSTAEARPATGGSRCNCCWSRKPDRRARWRVTA